MSQEWRILDESVRRASGFSHKPVPDRGNEQLPDQGLADPNELCLAISENPASEPESGKRRMPGAMEFKRDVVHS
jgi:hypothetical protein